MPDPVSGSPADHSPAAVSFTVPVLVFSALTVFTVALSFIDYSWSTWRPATCMPDACFCEAIRRGTVAQPSNTWSNLGFVLVGLLVLWQGRFDVQASSRRPRSSLIRSQLAYSAVFGVACVVMGLGSVFYHASLTFAGQYVDVMGMYLFAVFILLYGCARLMPMRGAAFVVGYVTLNLVLSYLLLEVPALRRWLFGSLLLSGIVIESLARRQATSRIEGHYLQLAMLVMAAAFGIWNLDLHKIICFPESLLQGHALWHLLGATGSGLLYLYYRSEQPAG